MDTSPFTSKPTPSSGTPLPAHHADLDCSPSHLGAEPPDPHGASATNLTSGSQFDFVWTLTVAHATSSFRYFVTRDGWDPSRPLTRAQLESEPFLTVPFDGQRPSRTVRHTGALPAGKSGRHMIFAVWDVADTTNAFYSCSDVDFG